MEDEVKRVFCEFITAMNHWETQCSARTAQEDRGELSWAECKELCMRELSVIHQQYCTTKLRPRSFTFREPPEYDPAAEHIDKLEIDENRADIFSTAECQGIVEKFKYVLVRESGQWRMAKKFRFGHEGSLLQEEEL